MNFKTVKNIFFIGDSESIEPLCEINRKSKIQSYVIVSKSLKIKLQKFVKIKKLVELNSDFKNFVKSNVKIEETLFISLNSKWIFNSKIIKFLKNRLINMHSTRLPFTKGGAGYSWLIMKNDRINSQTFHFVNRGIDTGKVVFSYIDLVPPSVRIPREFMDFDYLQLQKAYKFFIDKIKKKGDFKIVTQPKYLGNYYPRLYDKINGWIDWSISSIMLERYINAFDDPYEGAKTFINNQKVKIKSVNLHSGEVPNHPYMSGLVLRKSKNWILVALSDENSLIIEKVLNIKNVNIIENIKEGDRFFTPHKYKDKSLAFRARYDHRGLKKKN